MLSYTRYYFLHITFFHCLMHATVGQLTINNAEGWNPKGNALLQQNSILLDMKLQELRRENQQAQQAQQNLLLNISAEIKRVSDIEQQKLDRIMSRLQHTDFQSGILVQQHYDGTTFLNRTWSDYKVGFGDVTGNYWIGNDRLHELTKYGQYKMRFDLKAKANNQWYWAEYSTFKVDSESNHYMLRVGGYNGTAGDSLIVANGVKFSTVDRDNDSYGTHCTVASGRGGGFWYNGCGYIFINSPLQQGGNAGFSWYRPPTGASTSWTGGQLLISRMTLLLSN